jgi:hypothetical protein
MPYGYVLLSPLTRPLVSYTVPFVWRLSPLQPGYVMTVCALTASDQIEMMAKAVRHNDIRVDILYVLQSHKSARIFVPYINSSHENPSQSKLLLYSEQEAGGKAYMGPPVLSGTFRPFEGRCSAHRQRSQPLVLTGLVEIDRGEM